MLEADKLEEIAKGLDDAESDVYERSNVGKLREQVGDGDLRYLAEEGSGFVTVELYDADDHDLIILNEETIVALYVRLGKTIKEFNLSPERSNDEVATAE